MKTLDQGQDKIKKICDVLKKESLDPAKKEGERIIADAQARGHEIVKEAEKQAEVLLAETRSTLEQERNVFQSTMTQATRLCVESLKQEIQQKLFNQELRQLVEQQAADPKVIAKLIDAIVGALEKEGINANLTALVPKTVSPNEINALIGQNVLKKLKEQGVTLSGFAGGAKIRIADKKITIDITDQAIMEMLAGYAPGFRKWLFANQK